MPRGLQKWKKSMKPLLENRGQFCCSGKQIEDASRVNEDDAFTEDSWVLLEFLGHAIKGLARIDWIKEDSFHACKF